MMTLTSTIDELRGLLEELSGIDFGYPLGENAIRPPTCSGTIEVGELAAAACALRSLRAFYEACDGVNLPDVAAGYFLKPFRRVISFDRSSEPVSVVLDREIKVLPIGSTGSGDLFVMVCDDGTVLFLPPGPLHDGRYDGRGCRVRIVADNIENLLELIVADLRAFVRNDSKHRYITSGAE